MPLAPEHPEARPRFHRWLRGIAIGLEVAGFLVQIFLLVQLLDYRRHMGCGEQCAWTAMGLMLLLSMGSVVVVPGAVAAMYFARQAYRRWRQKDGPIVTVIVHAAPVGLFAFIVLLLMLPAAAVSVPAPKPARPPSVADQELAGYVWASDTGIVVERDCTKGTASFIAGCKRYARQHGVVAP